MTRVVTCSKFNEVSADMGRMGHAEYWLLGGRGSTKSSFAAMQIVMGLLEDTSANAIVYRRVGNTLADSVYAAIATAIGRLGWESLFKFRKSPLEIVRVDTGQRIMFRGADDPMKSKSIALTRGYFKFLWFEELTEFRSLEDVHSIQQSVLRGVDRAVTIFTYNPPKTAQNWVNEEALKPRADRFIHSSTYLDVIAEHREWLGESFIALADSIRETNERAYRNEYLGEVTGTGGNVFDNLELREISDEEINTFETFYNGLDFGFATDPDAFTRWAYSRRTRRLYAVAEYYGSHTNIDTLAEKVSALAGREVVRCDSADPRMISELKRRGITAVGVRKGAGSVEHGMRWLEDLGAIVADPRRTPNIAREFQKYEYMQDKNGNFLPAYPDKDNHCLTGDTLVCTVDGEKRIDELVGQIGAVICYDEENGRAATARFFDVRQTGAEEIFEIELEDGRILRASGEHPILTRRGWVPARQIAEDDEILEVKWHGNTAYPTRGAKTRLQIG